MNLHKVEDGDAQQVEGDADVAVEVEPVQHRHAEEAAIGVFWWMP
jgi:hypothetical protein